MEEFLTLEERLALDNHTMRQRIADLKAEEEHLEEIYLALDSLPLSGEKTGPKSRKFLDAIEHIKRLRQRVVELEFQNRSLSEVLIKALTNIKYPVIEWQEEALRLLGLHK